ncbi:hypothetical protein D3C77_330310 [compost metagenome]
MQQQKRNIFHNVHHVAKRNLLVVIAPALDAFIHFIAQLQDRRGKHQITNFGYHECDDIERVQGNGFNVGKTPVQGLGVHGQRGHGMKPGIIPMPHKPLIHHLGEERALERTWH